MLWAVLINQNITYVRGSGGEASPSHLRLCEHRPVRQCHLAKWEISNSIRELGLDKIDSSILR